MPLPWQKKNEARGGLGSGEKGMGRQETKNTPNMEGTRYQNTVQPRRVMMYAQGSQEEKGMKTKKQEGSSASKE